MDDASLRNLFHGALDEVVPEKPWLISEVREEVRRRQPELRLRRRFTIWTPGLRRAVAAMLIVAIAAGAAAATIALYERKHTTVPVIHQPAGPVTRACGIGSGVRMFDKNLGWRGTERTTDGGRTWHDVSPQGPPGGVKGAGATCALDPNVSWTTFAVGPAPYEPSSIVLMSTNNAGQSWQQDATISVPWSVSWQTNFSLLLDFYDLNHGWMFMEYATQPLQRKVFATSDGGRTWSVVSKAPDLGLGNMAFDCSQSGLTFATLQRGWLTWDCSSGFGDTPPAGTQVMAMTTDGGRTWVPVSLPSLPTGNDWSCGAASPIFTGLYGVTQVRCGGIGHAGSNQTYSTADGSATWLYHRLAGFGNVDFVNGTTGFYFQQPVPNGPYTLSRTDDGGGHWKVVATGLFPNESAGNFTFIDDKVGFADVSNSPGAWWTFDGGKTWSLRPPYRSAGNTVCGQFSDPGGEYQLPQDVKMVSPTVGWAPGTRLTTDGGIHWTRVAPPEPKNRATGFAEYFLNARQGWVVDGVGTASLCADRFVVYHTSDGGASWLVMSTTVVSGLDKRNALSGSWSIKAEFVDVEDGWILVQQGGGFGFGGPAMLYSTTDGGITWALVSPKVAWSSGNCSGSGLPLFSSPTTGWVAATCTGATATSANLLVTRDGGQTWSDVEMVKKYCDASSASDGCQFGGTLPNFFDADHGWWSDGTHLLMTSDGGFAWTAHGLPHGVTYICSFYGGSVRSLPEVHSAPPPGPQTCQSLYIDAVSFVSPSVGFVAAIAVVGTGTPTTLMVEETTDGGRTWTVVNRRSITIQSDQGEFFQFVDATHGFWWFGSTVTHTNDGGRTWTSARAVYS